MTAYYFYFNLTGDSAAESCDTEPPVTKKSSQHIHTNGNVEPEIAIDAVAQQIKRVSFSNANHIYEDRESSSEKLNNHCASNHTSSSSLDSVNENNDVAGNGMDSNNGDGGGGDRPNFIVGEDGLEENEAKDEFPQNAQNGMQPHTGYEVNLNEKRRRLRWVLFCLPPILMIRFCVGFFFFVAGACRQ